MPSSPAGKPSAARMLRFASVVDRMVVAPDVPVLRLDAGKSHQPVEACAVVHLVDTLSRTRAHFVRGRAAARRSGAASDSPCSPDRCDSRSVVVRSRRIEDQSPTAVQFRCRQNEGDRLRARADISIKNRSSSRLVVVGCLAANTSAPEAPCRTGWSNRRWSSPVPPASATSRPSGRSRRPACR